MLIEHILNKYKTISIVGMAKNAGKTVTLNALLDEAFEKEVIVGLTSIGRDGEKIDIVTFTDKPKIYAYKGTIIATSETLFGLSEAKMEVLEVTNFYTSLGRIIISRVINPGYVQIAGPCSNLEIVLTSNIMKNFGASLIIVDGAIDRKSTASPTITEGTILSTGAVLSRDMNKAIEKTAYQVSLFNIKEIENCSIRAIADKAIRAKQVTLINEDDSTVILDIKTALNAGSKIGHELNEKTRYIIIPGSLVKKTVLDIIESSIYYKNVKIVVRDATRIFIDYKDWMYFNRKKISICVLDKIKLIAISVNPYSPEGYFFDSEEYKNQLSLYVSPIPVINVMD